MDAAENGDRSPLKRIFVAPDGDPISTLTRVLSVAFLVFVTTGVIRFVLGRFGLYANVLVEFGFATLLVLWVLTYYYRSLAD